MAKRSRGAARPGQMRPSRRTQRPSGRGNLAATNSNRSALGALPPGETPVAEIELEIPLEERATSRGRGDRPQVEPPQARVRNAQPSSLLAARAAQEYGYVARDVRHIGVVGGGLVVVLAILFVLIEVMHVITI